MNPSRQRHWQPNRRGANLVAWPESAAGPAERQVQQRTPWKNQERCPLRDTQRGSPQVRRAYRRSESFRAGGVLQPFLRRRGGNQTAAERSGNFAAPHVVTPPRPLQDRGFESAVAPRLFIFSFFSPPVGHACRAFRDVVRLAGSCLLLPRESPSFCFSKVGSLFLCVRCAFFWRSVRYLCTFFFGSPHFLGICFCVILVRYILASSRCLTRWCLSLLTSASSPFLSAAGIAVAVLVLLTRCLL